MPRPTLILSALICFLKAAHAEPKALSAREAIALAVRRSPAVAAEGLQAAAADARVAEARASWLPRASLDAFYRYQGPVSELSIDTGITPPGASGPISISREAGSPHNAGTTLRAAWRAYDFGSRDLRTEAAEAASRAVGAQGAERRAEVAFAVRSAYLGALVSEESEAVTRRSIEIARAERSEHELRRVAGLGTSLELAAVDLRIAALDARLVEARRAREQALISLRILLGLPDGTPLVLSDSLELLSRQAIGAEADDQPALVRLGAQREAVLLQEDALWRSFWPTLDLFGQVSYVFPHTLFDTDVAGFTWMAGVTLTWEFFDGDLRRRQRDELELQAAALLETQSAVREDIRRRVLDARGRAETAREAEVAAQKQVAASEVYLEAALVAQKAGTGTALDIRKAEEALDLARMSVVNARFQGALAWADGLRALGQITEDGHDGEVVP